jgi:sucrose-6-phosphatase
LETLYLNQRLAQERSQFYLIYATGRSQDSYQQLCQEFLTRTGSSLLKPDYLIAGVGSQIYAQGLLDRYWINHIDQNWDRAGIGELVKSMPELLPQPESTQNEWKLSYFLNPDLPNNNLQIIKNLEQKLDKADLQAQVIFSSDQDVDILPTPSGKGNAVNYLRQKLQINPELTLVCGDSGNDIEMFKQGTLGVIVHNAQPELLAWLEAQSSELSEIKVPYLSSCSYAWAIADALEHCKIFDRTSFKGELNVLLE